MVREKNDGEGFTQWLSGKESAWNAGDMGSVPGLGRSPGRRARQPTPVFLSREFHGQRRSLAGYSPWGRKELDMTEGLTLLFSVADVGELIWKFC